MNVVSLVSIFPFRLSEKKPGLYPTEYNIEPGTPTKPSITIIREAIAKRYLGNFEYIDVPVAADKVATSIINDYKIAKVCYRVDEDGEKMPGLFWVPDEVNLKTLNEKYTHDLDKARHQQREWFKELVSYADDLWAKLHQPKAIIPEMRAAVEHLGLKREWNDVWQVEDMVACIACTTLIRSAAIICPHCQVVNKPDEFKKLNLQKAS